MKQCLLNLANWVLALPRPVKRIIVFVIDLNLCTLTVWLAYYLRLGEFIDFTGSSVWNSGFQWSRNAAIVLALPIFILSGLYRAIFRYNGWQALLTVAQSVGLYGIVYVTIFTVIGVDQVPRTIGIIQPILLLLFVGASRTIANQWLGNQYQSLFKQKTLSNVLIYGAGSAGRQLAAALTNIHDMKLVGFLDDDVGLQGYVLNGQPIYDPKDLPRIVTKLNVSHILLAMPSSSRTNRKAILEKIRGTRVSVHTLPSVSDLATGKVTVSDLRELDLDDLLGRDPIDPDPVLLAKNIHGQVVLVTGAGGSIGSELCRQIITVHPSKLLLIEQNEFALYMIHQELEKALDNQHIEIVPLLASVQDHQRMEEIMGTWHPHTIYHAAAYKHVPLVEHNPVEGIKNNVFGTMYTAYAALTSGVNNFVLISTDKAVRPTNIMGASKRLAEITLQSLAATNPSTQFSIVRFGNVLGSSGSVVPKFRQQICNGGPVTITHPDITRYFMTIPEAAQLVIQAGAMAQGGDVFVLDMGQSVKIMDLAHRMIELSGRTVRDVHNPNGDIEILITGLRPGEKLYEELLIGHNPQGTSHSKIMKAHEDFIPWQELQGTLHQLERLFTTNDITKIRAMMEELVHGYTPQSEIVDWIYLEHILKT
jgi:FlaA1/EpsC-like NDP-sugar epimerase